MLQRPTTGWSAGRAGPRPLRVLVESADPAFAVADFTRLDAAGFDVALCAGPAGDATECPLVRDEACPLVAGADVVLVGRGPRRAAVVGAIRRHHPETPLVVQLDDVASSEMSLVPQDSETLPQSVSVEGQIRVLRRAAIRGRRARVRSWGG